MAKKRKPTGPRFLALYEWEMNLPASFDPCRYPILAHHWFGVVPLFVPVTRQHDDASEDAEAA